MTKAIPWIFIIAGGVLVAAGVAVGDPSQVLRQAVMVCLECVGIG